MTMLYRDGEGEVYHNMLKWIRMDNVDLQTTGVLALGNFARCGKSHIYFILIGSLLYVTHVFILNFRVKFTLINLTF